MNLSSNGRLKIAVQKSGRLTEESIRLLRTCGLDFEYSKESLYSPCRNFPLDLLALRDDDLPEYVRDGVAELGIVGQNVLLEQRSDVNMVEPLGFGKCRLTLSVPETSRIKTIKDLKGLRIATTYPRLLGDFLKARRIKSVFIELSGSVELAPALDVAEAVCDIVSTGTTAKLHGLRPLVTVMESEAVLIANRAALKQAASRALIDRILIRIRAVLAARGQRYLMMNAPREAVPRIQKVLPSLKSPTVMPLAQAGMVAIHTVVPDESFWEVMERLKKCGASDIVILPIEMIQR